MINGSFTWRSADPDAQTWDLFGPKLGDNRIQAVVIARPSAQAQAKPTERKSKIIQHDQGLLRFDLIKLCNCQQWLATAIHKAQRFDQKHSATFRAEGVPFSRFLPSRSELRSQLIDHHEPDVVPRGCVLRAGISETGDEPDWC